MAGGRGGQSITGGTPGAGGRFGGNGGDGTGDSGGGGGAGEAAGGQAEGKGGAGGRGGRDTALSSFVSQTFLGSDGAAGNDASIGGGGGGGGEGGRGSLVVIDPGGGLNKPPVASTGLSQGGAGGRGGASPDFVFDSSASSQTYVPGTGGGGGDGGAGYEILSTTFGGSSYPSIELDNTGDIVGGAGGSGGASTGFVIDNDTFQALLQGSPNTITDLLRLPYGPGGDGGRGGAGVRLAANTMLVNDGSGRIAGGVGGSAGANGDLKVSDAPANIDSILGIIRFAQKISAPAAGTGGTGGAGVVAELGSAVTNSDTASITGGNGGDSGGAGGAGLLFLLPGFGGNPSGLRASTFTNRGNATVTGGTGSSGERPGNGGDGVFFGGETLSNEDGATITGGAAGTRSGGSFFDIFTGTPTPAVGGNGVTFVGAALINGISARIVGGASTGGAGAGGFPGPGIGGDGVLILSASATLANGGVISGGAGSVSADFLGGGTRIGEGGAGVRFVEGGQLFNGLAGRITGGIGLGSGVEAGSGSRINNDGFIAAGGSNGSGFELLFGGGGGFGIVGENLTITNTGSISGAPIEFPGLPAGLASDAVRLSGDGNVLALGASARFTGSINVQSGRLTFDQSNSGQPDDATLTSAVVGSGDLVKTGRGTLTLAGASPVDTLRAFISNGRPGATPEQIDKEVAAFASQLGLTPAFTGTTTISDGTLRIGAGGTVGSLEGDIVNNATLAFDRSDAYGFAGTISGSGAVRQIGSGTTTLSAANSYAGGTVITDGTLALTAAQSAGSGVIAFQAETDGFTVLRLSGSAEPASGTPFGNTLVDFAAGDVLNLTGLAYTPGSTADLSLLSPPSGGLQLGLIVSSNGRSETFTLDGAISLGYATADNGFGGTLVGVASTGRISATDGTTYNALNNAAVPLVVYGGTGLSYTVAATTSETGSLVLTVGNGRVSQAVDLGIDPRALGLDFSTNTAAVSLQGGAYGDRLTGGTANDILDGRGGTDTLIGGTGNDIYYVESAGDQAIEAIGDGSDTVFTSASYVLTAGQEIERLETTNAAATTSINMSGNDFDQTIVGNAANNAINGRAGANTLVGLGGNDTYFVSSADDRVIEAVGGGDDKVVVTTGSYMLAAGQEIETLQTINAAGTTSINLSGNEFGQTIRGNATNNFINGRGGTDTLIGMGGNDTYYVDSVDDRVIEAASGGTDTVLTSASYMLFDGQKIETLQTISAAGIKPINLTGNEFGQVIRGNAGSNVLNGKGGTDLLIGLGGADTFVFNTALSSGNVDRIGDFVASPSAVHDTIQLARGIFTALAPGEALDANAFKETSTGEIDGNDRILYDKTTGALSYDADGLVGAAAVQFATLDNKADLSHLDFLIA